jgi:large subunit ribosomal protein L7/L12
MTEEKKEEVKVPEKFKNLVKEIETLSVLDLAELVKVLEDKFGVSAAPQVIAAQPSAAGNAGGASAESEKSIFTIELKEVGAKKIEVIKAIRDITQKGLKEAKDLVDAAEKTAQVVKENSKKEEAEEIKKKLEAAGAKVELK